MTRKKRFPQGSTALDLAEETPTRDDQVLDHASAAALLDVEYPLIDSTLIIALLSDYSPLLSSHLEEIRAQLGVLEATLVPDYVPGGSAVDAGDGSSTSTSDAGPQLDDELVKGVDRKIERLALNDPPPFSISSAGSGDRLNVPISSEKLSSSTSASGSRASTSSTSLADSDGGFEDDVSMLKSLFPSLDEKLLRDALIHESGVPSAIDYLLSMELIRDVEREGRWPEEQSSLTDEEDSRAWQSIMDKEPLKQKVSAPPSPALSVRTLPAKTSRKKSTKTVPLVDTLQRRSTPSGSRSASRMSSRAASPARRPLPAPASNAWGTVSSVAAYLADTLPGQPPTYYSSYLHSPAYHSAYTAVRAALANLPANKRPSDDMSRAILEDIYGLTLENESNQKVNEDLIVCVRAAGDDVAAVMDLMDLLAEISEWPGDDLDRYDAVNEQYYASHFPTDKRAGPPVSRTQPPIPDLSAGPQDVLPTQEALLSLSDGEHAPRLSRKRSGRMTAPPKKQQITIGANTILNEPIQKFVPGATAPLSSLASPTAFDSFGSPSNFALPSPRSRSKDRQIHPQNWRTISTAGKNGKPNSHSKHIPAYNRGGLPNRPGPGSLSRKSSGPSASQVDEYLSKAAAERQKREDAIRLAGRHYRGNLAGGKAINGAVAGAYALQAREAMEKARGWEMKAARMVVSDQLDQSGYTIDLHHLTIAEATTVALESASTWYEREKIRQFGGIVDQSRNKAVGFTPSRGLVVVVGVGRHSAGGKGVLGPAVANALESAGWRVDRGENGRGYLLVRGRR